MRNHTGPRCGSGSPSWHAAGLAVLPRVVVVLGATLLLVLASCAGAPSLSEQFAAERFAHERSGPPAAWADEWFMEGPIYEVFVRNFTPEGTLAAMIPRLSELSRLGIKTIWLMPIHPVGEVSRKGELGSPYSVRDFYAVNPRFGTKDDLRALVDAAHELDMRVILDMVANHTAWDHPWVTEHPDWYTTNAAGEIIPPNEDWTDVADLNFDNQEMRREMRAVLRYWVQEFDIDGYRADVAWGVPTDFWAEAIAELESIKDVFMLAEAEDQALLEAGFDAIYGWESHHETKRVFRGGDVNAYLRYVAQEAADFPEEVLMQFTTNHDETSWDDTPIAIFGGPQAARAAAVVAYSQPGVPLIYNGQEVGSRARQNLFVRDPIDWSGGEEFRSFYDSFFEIWRSSEALRYGGLATIEQASNLKVYAISRLTDSEEVVVLVNLRDRPRTFVPAYDLGVFTDEFTGESVDLSSLVDLGAHEYRVFRRDR